MSVSNKMFVPKTITVGFQERKDTYTGKLAYVIYTDDKGVLRKEKSWDGWRNKKIDSIQHDNVPTSGFVLNKKVGGYKSHFDVRQTYVRVYDARDFEFEITVPNLLFILQETSCIQGKGLEGDFVYSWHGTDLVLLPSCSGEYQQCMTFTKHQSTKVGKENMVEGCTYIMRDMTNVMYLGRHDYCDLVRWSTPKEYRPMGPRHVFVNLDREDKDDPYIAQTGFEKISAKTSDVTPQYAAEFEKFKNSRYSDKVVSFELSRVRPSNLNYTGGCFVMKEGDEHTLIRLWAGHHLDRSHYFNRGQKIDLTLKKGTVPLRGMSYSGNRDETLGDREVYSVMLVTEKGHHFNLTKNL